MKEKKYSLMWIVESDAKNRAKALKHLRMAKANISGILSNAPSTEGAAQCVADAISEMEAYRPMEIDRSNY